MARQLQAEADREAAASAPPGINEPSGFFMPFAMLGSVLMGSMGMYPARGEGTSGRNASRSQGSFRPPFPLSRGAFQIDPRLLGLSMVDRVRSLPRILGLNAFDKVLVSGSRA